MSLDAVSAFLDRVKEDPDFRDAVAKCKTKEERQEFVRAAGLEFTAQELEEALSQLSLEELEHVAGGNSIMGFCLGCHNDLCKEYVGPGR